MLFKQKGEKDFFMKNQEAVIKSEAGLLESCYFSLFLLEGRESFPSYKYVKGNGSSCLLPISPQSHLLV